VGGRPWHTLAGIGATHVRVHKKSARSAGRTGRLFVSKKIYRLARLEALSGLIFCVLVVTVVVTWVARLQLPFFHFAAGSGQAVQNHPAPNSCFRPQPSQDSTTSWQTPPL
jgi:hypothetical protein